MVEDETRTEIDQLGAEAVAPGLCALALSLARSADTAEAPTALAAVAAQLRAVMADIRKLSPPAVKGDAVDELTSRREGRRRGA
ncbi:hypothetical protein [Streptomyces sp. NPDC023838]|uniref:hypothetical protein n=1 Tax=Streptomyces sp. NPDC023838 TaxID=3154325 RepID=UPI0033FCD7D3